MVRYVLDTNLYIAAFRNVDAAEMLRRYYANYTPNTFLNSVVLHELLIGSNTPAKARQVQDSIAEPFRRTRRLITPGAGAWATAADAVAQMSRREKREVRTLPRSLINDYLLAASCRETGITLITENTADFKQISRYVKVSFTAPWPE